MTVVIENIFLFSLFLYNDIMVPTVFETNEFIFCSKLELETSAVYSKPWRELMVVCMLWNAALGSYILILRGTPSFPLNVSHMDTCMYAVMYMSVYVHLHMTNLLILNDS